MLYSKIQYTFYLKGITKMDIYLPAAWTDETVNFLSDGGRNTIHWAGNKYIPPTNTDDMRNLRSDRIGKDNFYELFNHWVVARINSLTKISRYYFVVPTYRTHMRYGNHPGLFNQLGEPNWDSQEFGGMGVAPNLYHITDNGNNNIDLADLIDTIYPYVNQLSRLCLANITSNGNTTQHWAICVNQRPIDLWGLLTPIREMTISYDNVVYMFLKIHDKLIENARNYIINYSYGDELRPTEISRGVWWPGTLHPNRYIDHDASSFGNNRDNVLGIIHRNIRNVERIYPNMDNNHAQWGGNIDLIRDASRGNQWGAAALYVGFSGGNVNPAHMWLETSAYIDYTVPWVGKQFSEVMVRIPARKHMQYFDGYQLDHFNTDGNNGDNIMNVNFEIRRNGNIVYVSDVHKNNHPGGAYDVWFNFRNFTLQNGDVLRLIVNITSLNSKLINDLRGAASRRNIPKLGRYGIDFTFGAMFDIKDIRYR